MKWCDIRVLERCEAAERELVALRAKVEPITPVEALRQVNRLMDLYESLRKPKHYV